MSLKRDREEETQPVVQRRGAGMQELAGGHVSTIETLTAQLDEQKVRIDEHVQEIAKQNVEIKIKNRELAVAAQVNEAQREEGT